jgi:hypothetical protein
MGVVEGEPMVIRRDPRAEFATASCYGDAAKQKEHRSGVKQAAPTVQAMNSRFVVSAIFAGALMFAGCSNGSGGYSGSYSGATYDNGSSSAASSSSSAAGDSSLSSDVHSVLHTEKEDERIHRARKTEALLDVSGFKSMPIDTPAKQKVIGGLTPLSFNELGHHGKIHYWFADPYYCKCVYVGNELAYLRYKQAKKERKEDKVESAYLVDQENQVDLPMDSEWDPGSAFGMP